VDCWLILAESNQVLGRIEETRWKAKKVLKLKPEFSLAKFAELRRAGL